MSATTFEQLINRKLTLRYIDTDPTLISLITKTKVARPGGSVSFQSNLPLAAQKFKVIYQGGNGIVSTSEGQTRKFDFIIVGKHDATVDIGSYWEESEQRYEITYLFPYNGYEIKAGGITHGINPNHG